MLILYENVSAESNLRSSSHRKRVSIMAAVFSYSTTFVVAVLFLHFSRLCLTLRVRSSVQSLSRVRLFATP